MEKKKQGRFTSFFIKDIIANEEENQLEIKTRLQGKFLSFHQILIELKSCIVLPRRQRFNSDSLQASRHFEIFDRHRF